MKLSALFVAASLLAAPSLSHAAVHLLLESNADKDGGQELFVAKYPDRDAFLNNNFTSSQFLPQDLSADFSVADLAYDHGVFRLLLESNADKGGGEELFVANYNSYDDLLNGNFSSSTFLQQDLSGDYSVHGFTYGDAGFTLLLESDADKNGGEELFVANYATYDDLVNGAFNTSTFLPQDLSGDFSVAGLGYDKGAYDLLLESNDDKDGGEELFVARYNSYDDLLNGNFASSQFLPQDISGDYSVHGFEYEPEVTNGGGGGVPEPSAWALMILGFGAVGAVQRRRLRLA